MPNHVTIRIATANHEDLKGRLLNDEGHVDFNRVIPMPEGVSTEGSGHIMAALERAGKPTWYSWSIQNWGTKWNAYASKVEPTYIEFQCAWNCPEAVIQALSQQMVGQRLFVAYADEDIGSNCGAFELIDGVKFGRFPVRALEGLEAMTYVLREANNSRDTGYPAEPLPTASSAPARNLFALTLHGRDYEEDGLEAETDEHYPPIEDITDAFDLTGFFDVARGKS